VRDMAATWAGHAAATSRTAVDTTGVEEHRWVSNWRTPPTPPPASTSRRGQRASGEPYVNHLIEVAALLAEARQERGWCCDGGLLHDSSRDTSHLRGYGTALGPESLPSWPRCRRQVGAKEERKRLQITRRRASAARQAAEARRKGPPPCAAPDAKSPLWDGQRRACADYVGG